MADLTRQELDTLRYLTEHWLSIDWILHEHQLLCDIEDLQHLIDLHLIVYQQAGGHIAVAITPQGLAMAKELASA